MSSLRKKKNNNIRIRECVLLKYFWMRDTMYEMCFETVQQTNKQSTYWGKDKIGHELLMLKHGGSLHYPSNFVDV